MESLPSRASARKARLRVASVQTDNPSPRAPSAPADNLDAVYQRVALDVIADLLAGGVW